MSVRPTMEAVHRYVQIQLPHFSVAADQDIHWAQMAGFVMVSLFISLYSGLPSQLFLQPWQKAWLRPGSQHHMMCAIAKLRHYTRVYEFIYTLDVFHVVLFETLATLCSGVTLTVKLVSQMGHDS